MTYREFVRDYPVDDLCKYCKLYDECKNGDEYPPCADLANDDEMEFIDADMARNNDNLVKK